MYMETKAPPGYYRDDYGLELKQAKLDREWERRLGSFLHEHSVSEVDTISVEEATKAVGCTSCTRVSFQGEVGNFYRR